MIACCNRNCLEKEQSNCHASRLAKESLSSGAYTFCRVKSYKRTNYFACWLSCQRMASRKSSVALASLSFSLMRAQ